MCWTKEMGVGGFLGLFCWVRLGGSSVTSERNAMMVLGAIIEAIALPRVYGTNSVQQWKERQEKRKKKNRKMLSEDYDWISLYYSAQPSILFWGR